MVTPSIPVGTPGAKWLYLSLGLKVRVLRLTAVISTVSVCSGSKSVVAIAICTALETSEAGSKSVLVQAAHDPEHSTLLPTGQPMTS